MHIWGGAAGIKKNLMRNNFNWKETWKKLVTVWVATFSVERKSFGLGSKVLITKELNGELNFKAHVSVSCKG